METIPCNCQERLIILRALPSRMRLDGWTKVGTTDDMTILREIRRDYLAKGKPVAFSLGAMFTVHYWTKPGEVQP